MNKNIFIAILSSLVVIGCGPSRMSWNEFEGVKNTEICTNSEGAESHNDCKINLVAYKVALKVCENASKHEGYSSVKYCILMNESKWDALTFHLDNLYDKKPTLEMITKFPPVCFSEEREEKPCPKLLVPHTVKLKPTVVTDMERKKLIGLLNSGAEELFFKKNPEGAIVNYFDKIISFFETRYKNSKANIYSARSEQEKSYYLRQAAEKDPATNAIVVDWFFAQAYYLKSYALISLKRDSEALALSKRVVNMSPKNSQYLSELAYHYTQLKDWDAALLNYRGAEFAAKEFSSKGINKKHLGKALRGQGYVLVELKKLSEAEALYKKALELNKNDRKSIAELQYIQSLRENKNK